MKILIFIILQIFESNNGQVPEAALISVQFNGKIGYIY